MNWEFTEKKIHFLTIFRKTCLIRHLYTPFHYLIRHLYNPFHCLIRHLYNPFHCLIRHLYSPFHCLIRHLLNPFQCLIRHLYNPCHCVIRHKFPFPFNRLLWFWHCVIRHLVYSNTNFFPSACRLKHVLLYTLSNCGHNLLPCGNFADVT